MLVRDIKFHMNMPTVHLGYEFFGGEFQTFFSQIIQVGCNIYLYYMTLSSNKTKKFDK